MTTALRSAPSSSWRRPLTTGYALSQSLRRRGRAAGDETKEPSGRAGPPRAAEWGGPRRRGSLPRWHPLPPGADGCPGPRRLDDSPLRVTGVRRVVPWPIFHPATVDHAQVKILQRRRTCSKHDSQVPRTQEAQARSGFNEWSSRELGPQSARDLEVNGVLSARGGKHAGPRGACPRVPRARSHARQCSWWRERRAGHPR